MNDMLKFYRIVNTTPDLQLRHNGVTKPHYYQYTRPNRKSASLKHTLCGPQKTDSSTHSHCLVWLARLQKERKSENHGKGITGKSSLSLDVLKEAP